MAQPGNPLPEPGFESPLAAAITLREAGMLATVRRALSRGDVTLAYQPVVHARAPDRPAFWEGLIRLSDEAGHAIPAGRFMADVENTETGRLIDCRALELGLSALARVPDLRLSVNMSARSVGYPRWRETLAHGLAAEPTVGERLILEITEASAMQVPELVSAFMADLARRGIAFALDDFGAGHTAFRYLKQFCFDILKIDGQFIRDVDTDPDNQVLVQALVSIGRHFDMLTVAESVETAAEAAFLAGAGLDCLQGYHCAAPMIVPPWEEARRRRA